MKLTTHLHLASKLVMRGTVPPLYICLHVMVYKPRDNFIFTYLKDDIYRTNPHTIHELQAEIEVGAVFVTVEMVLDRLKRIHELWLFHTEHVFTWRPTYVPEAVHESELLFMYHTLPYPRKH